MYLRAQMVSVCVLGVFLDFGDTIRKDGRLERGAENAKNQAQEEGDGRSPETEWEALESSGRVRSKMELGKVTHSASLPSSTQN